MSRKSSETQEKSRDPHISFFEDDEEEEEEPSIRTLAAERRRRREERRKSARSALKETKEEKAEYEPWWRGYTKPKNPGKFELLDREVNSMIF